MPTRNRLPWLDRLFASLMENSEHPENIEIVLYLDDDDPTRDAIHHPTLNLVKLIGPRTTMGGFNTACMRRSTGDIVICINDDMVVRTPSWDRKVREFHGTLADGIYLAHANDLFLGDRLCAIPILSRKTCDVLADPYPVQYPGGFIDYHLYDTFRRLEHMGKHRRFFLRDVVIEHLHYLYGKAQCDSTYEYRGHFDVGEEIFVALSGYRQITAKRLAAAIDGAELPPLPRIDTIPPIPQNTMQAVFYFWRATIMDPGLAFGWRLTLFKFLTDRYLAKKYQIIVDNRPLNWRWTIYESTLGRIFPVKRRK